jgi:hypothetical protein
LKGGNEKMKKKSKAGMEFLLTYGWSILAGVIAIGVLLYFGVFSPQSQIPEKEYRLSDEDPTSICLSLNEDILMKAGDFPKEKCAIQFKGRWIYGFDGEGISLICDYKIFCSNSNINYLYDSDSITFKEVKAEQKNIKN